MPDKINNIVASITTWKERISFLPKAIESIKQQTLKPGKIVCVLSRMEFNETEIPDILLNDKDIEIKWTDNNPKSWKKYLPIQDNPDKYVVLFDDDFIYCETIIEELYNYATKNNVDGAICYSCEICNKYFQPWGRYTSNATGQNWVAGTCTMYTPWSFPFVAFKHYDETMLNFDLQCDETYIMPFMVHHNVKIHSLHDFSYFYKVNSFIDKSQVSALNVKFYTQDKTFENNKKNELMIKIVDCLPPEYKESIILQFPNFGKYNKKEQPINLGYNNMDLKEQLKLIADNNTINTQCAVVIPIYKEFNKLEDTEFASLEQARKIFGNKHDIYFLTHDLIDIKKYIQAFNNSNTTHIVYVDKNILSSRKSYARFLSDRTIYEAFSEYQYMLIYQLDAFVFSDKLKYWCDLGYDYIGAPLYREDFVKIGKRVGNGGFSLRKISAILNYIDKNYNIDNEHRWFDDAFFSMNYGDILNIPTVDIARKFSIEGNAEEEFKLSGELPFGCHAFNIFNKEFWKKYIPLYSNAYDLLKMYLENNDVPINTKSDWWLYDKLSLTAYYSGHKKNSLLYSFIARELNTTDKRLQDNVNVILDNINKDEILGLKN